MKTNLVPDVDTNQSFKKAWGQILAKTWQDPRYRLEVENDPNKALTDFGVQIPNELKFSVKPKDPLSNASIVVLPFPEKPSDLTHLYSNSNEPHILAAAAGSSSSSSTCCCCP